MRALALGITVLVVLFLFVPCYVVPAYAQEPPLIEVLNYLGFTNVAETTIEIFPAGTYNITLYAEFAGNHEINELSYYDVGEVVIEVFNVIFTGPEGNYGYISPPISKMFTADYVFGLSMRSAYRYFTETFRNPDGLHHAIVYRNLDDPYMFLVGFENAYAETVDRDFNDMVFSIRYEAPPLSVSIDPATSRIKIGESVTFTSTVSGGAPEYSYQWYLNGSAVSGATASTWTFTPETTGFYTVYLVVTDSFGVTTQSEEASVTVAPPLTVSISPLSASIFVGESVEFTSTVSGGYSPYSYQWYLDDSPVSGATSASWTFTPTSEGIYYVYLKVTDAEGNVVQSDVARITVSAVPVGGYSVSLSKDAPTLGLINYTVVIALFGVALSLLRRKRK